MTQEDLKKANNIERLIGYVQNTYDAINLDSYSTIDDGRIYGIMDTLRSEKEQILPIIEAKLKKLQKEFEEI